MSSIAGEHGSFAIAATNDHPGTGHRLNEVNLHAVDGPHVSSTGGSGFLAFFQEASSNNLAVSIGGEPAVNLAAGAFIYGPVPAGTYAITVSEGASTFASGTVSVANGQDVTALVYLAVGGQPTIAGFVNDRSPLAVGQSRIVFRNTANVGPLDMYINGTKVAFGLVNDPSSSSDTIDVPAGPITIEAVPANKPESDYLYAQNGVLVAGDLLNVFVVGDSTTTPSTVAFLTNANPLGSGYRLYASDGGVFDFGNANYYGSMGGKHLNKPVVGAAPTSNGIGYWLVASDGGVFSFGDASFYGSTGNLTLNQPIVAIVPTVDGTGYWLVASDGGVFSFGDAFFYGSTGNIRLNEPIVGAITSPDSLGYWLVASDGGIFTFGDASFYGSTGNIKLAKPIVTASSDGAPLPT